MVLMRFSLLLFIGAAGLRNSPRQCLDAGLTLPRRTCSLRLVGEEPSVHISKEEGLAAVLKPASSPTGISPSVAFLLLNGVAVIWGSQHPIIKGTLETFPTSSLNFWRFLLSTMLFFPALVGVLKKSAGEEKERLIRGGAELGLYTFAGFAFQSIGLETTTASRSAFLLYLNVKFVPFLAAVLYRRRIPSAVWGSAALALTGTFLLSTDSASSAFNVGDVWCIAAAFASALFILRLEGVSQSSSNAAEVSGVCSATTSLLCLLWVLLDSPADLQRGLIDPLLDNPWPPLYLGLVTTSLCGWLQVQGQRVIPAERASIIYSLDPLYGAAFSSLLLHEQLGARGLVGGLFILAGVALSSLSSSSSSSSSPSSPGKGSD